MSKSELKKDLENFMQIARNTSRKIDNDNADRFYDELYGFENDMASAIRGFLGCRGYDVGDATDDMQGESINYANGIGFSWTRDDYPVCVVLEDDKIYEVWAVFRHGKSITSRYSVFLSEINVSERRNHE
jgi:hypothetical protein